jgi:5-aminolevulinate synthase
MNYNGYFRHALARLRNERRYRVFADLERIAERYPRASGTRLRARVAS